jgi:hypothetical protein
MTAQAENGRARAFNNGNERFKRFLNEALPES